MKIKPIRFFFDLLYPNLCLICNDTLTKTENQICIKCVNEIPKTNYHLLRNNPIEKRFWGKVPVFRATSFFHFQKGSPFQKLLHSLKYRGNQNIGVEIAKFAAVELLDSPDFQTIDVIVPVPLHPFKLHKRGYNQSECLARGMAMILDKPVEINVLSRLKDTSTQTKKTVFERYINTDGIFDVSDTDKLSGKHILLIDDVLTTGSTLEACITALLKISNVKISVFTLAVA